MRAHNDPRPERQPAGGDTVGARMPETRATDHVPDGRDATPLPDEMSAEELFERIRDGEERAAAALYRRYYPALLRFAFGSLHMRADAEEVVQDVFLALWERRETLQIQVSVTAYLYTAVRNRILRTAKHDAIVARTETQSAATGHALAMGEPPVAPDTRLENSELVAHVLRAVDALSERRRLALTLRWRHQLPYTDIAAIMGASVEAVTIQVARAREQVARLLQASTGMG